MLNYQKIKNLILHIVTSCQNEKEGITLFKLAKILYFIDFGYFAQNSKSISGIDYLKFQYGPVPRGLRDYIKLLEGDNLLERKTYITNDTEKEVLITQTGKYLDKEIFTEKEVKTINNTINGTRGLNSRQLSEETHYHQSWITTSTGNIIDYEKSKYCVFEWLDYYHDMDKKEYLEVKESRKIFKDKDVTNLLSTIQTL